METQTKNLIKYLILPLLVLSVLFAFYFKHEEQDWLHVNFYDVGQGDAFLITTYEGNQILVDGGPGDTVVEKLAQDLGPYDKDIDMVVLTHAHLDHFEGLIAVMTKYEVEKILMPNVEFKSNEYLAFLDAVKKENAEVLFAIQGQRFFLDRGTVLDILYPATKETIRPKKSADINDTSIVAMLRFGKTNFLLTGDSGKNIESELLPAFNLDADLLKVGHHGSKYSSSEEWLKAVTPKYAVIQLGEKNTYGHPAPEVIDRLKAMNTDTYRSDLHGDVEFVSDGTNIRLQK